jgi:hypothetical protein
MAEEKPKKPPEVNDPAYTKTAGQELQTTAPQLPVRTAAAATQPECEGTGVIRGTVFDDSQRSGIPGVPVTLLDCNTHTLITGTQNHITTGPDGAYRFASVPPGSYRVAFPFNPAGPPTSLGAAPDPRLEKVVVLAADQERVADFHYSIIGGQLLLQGGAGIGFTNLTLANGASSTNADTDADGAFAFLVPVGDGYKLTVPLEVDAGVAGIKFDLKDGRFPNGAASNLSCPSILSGVLYSSGPLIGGITGQIQQIGQSTETIAAIIPTAMQAPAALPSPGAGLVSYDQLVEASLTRVLGARTNGDASKIISLLNASFTSREQDGQTYYSWQPRGVTSVSSSMGQLVGGQVTLYQQAQDIQSQAARLLDAVEPIILDADDEDIDAFKSDIATSLAAIVSETGRPGGAVTPRVQVLLQTLQGDLDTLQTKLGFKGVVDPALFIDMDVTEREQNQQNFSLLQTLLRVGGTLDSLLKATNTAQFSGTQLARLNWLAEVIPDTVQQIYMAMDSVGFGPADRRVTPIGDSDTTTIEQLLLWIESAASVDWPSRLVPGSARITEVQAIQREADSQAKGVATLLGSLGSIIPIGADRSRPVLQELLRELQQVSDLAQAITRPTATAFSRSAFATVSARR